MISTVAAEEAHPELPPDSRRPSPFWTALRRVAACLGLLGVLAVHFGGMWVSVLVSGMPVVLLLGIGTRLVLHARGQLEGRLLTAPRSPGMVRHRAQWLLRTAFWLTAGLALVVAIPSGSIAPGEYYTLLGMVIGMAVVLALMESIQRRAFHYSGNVLFGVALALLLSELVPLSRPPAPQVMLVPPFRGRWVVVNGGNSTLVNHHHAISAQAHALDLVMDQVHDASALQKRESYAAWGKPLYAPAPGRVVVADDSQPDQPIGGSDVANPVGNQVVIQIGQDQYVLLAHLQQGSIRVKPGDAVKAGDLLGRCGNSGNTSEPHLHIQVQNRAKFDAPDLRTYPIGWQEAELTRAGQPLAQGAVLRRNDRIDAGEKR